MKDARCCSRAVCIKGEIYELGGFDYDKNMINGRKSIKSVKKYSPDSNTFEYLNNMIDGHQNFSACSMINHFKLTVFIVFLT